MSNGDIAKKWSRALRSGVYAQGQGRAKDVRGGKMVYCCLGVLSEVLGEALEVGRSLPSPRVLESTLHVVGIGYWEFAVLNDTLRRSFAEIADVVDAASEKHERGIRMMGSRCGNYNKTPFDAYVKHILSEVRSE